jgi:catechol O-methyltransferase
MNSTEFTEEFPQERIEKMFASRGDLQDHVLHNARKGNIQNIIDTIDEYGWTKQWLMNIGDRKGKILDQAIQTRQPKTVLELGKICLIINNNPVCFLLGTFLGYSSLRIVAQLATDALFITIEADTQSADIARSIHEYAGVTDRIKIINDYTENVIPHLNKTFNIDSFDLIFIDHFKDIYLRDFKMLEDVGLIKSGTMIVADNVIKPGAPDYLEYVRNNPNYTTTFYEEYLEYRDDLVDGIEISIRK